MTSSASVYLTMYTLAPEGHAETHLPQLTHFARPALRSMPMPSGHTFAHSPHPMHFLLCHPMISCLEKPSGFEHHSHLRGHPARNIVVLMPSPSLTENGWTSITYPFTCIFLLKAFVLKAFVTYQNSSWAFLAIIESCISLERFVN